MIRSGSYTAGRSGRGYRFAADLLAAGQVDTLSLDIFDTVLLRTPKPEILHLRRIAARACHRLKERLGVAIESDDIWRARLLAQRIAYQSVGQVVDMLLEDTTHAKILALQCIALGLPDAAIEVLAQAEFDQEVESVVANPAVLRLIDAARASDVRVVFTTDIYLDSTFLRALLARHGLSLCYQALYVSSDEGRTKRAGGLFDVLVLREGCPAHRLLHVGDNRNADVRMAARRGLSTAWVPRPMLFRAKRRLSGFVASRLHGI